MTADATWLLRMETTGYGPRLAVKDCIDIAGTPTTVGCPAIADEAVPAGSDAAVVATARQQGARIVGKTNLVELCRHIDGVNPWTGTPRNPIDPERLPGGSSSGSAVAVALDQADVGYGTDTGGSVRVPAACCGIAGLKTTSGRVPTHGVFEFSRTLDTVGPLARDVGGLVTGMDLIEPGFHLAEIGDAPLTAARLRLPGVAVTIDEAVDAALAAAGMKTTDVAVPEWEGWIVAANQIMTAEGYWAHRHLLDRSDRLEDRDVRSILAGKEITASRVVESRRTGMAARARLAALLDQHDVLALPTLRALPPRIGELERTGMTDLTVPLNLAGLPAVALPVLQAGPAFPASVQLVGRWYDDERLLAVAREVETAPAVTAG